MRRRWSVGKTVTAAFAIRATEKIRSWVGVYAYAAPGEGNSVHWQVTGIRLP